MKTYACHLVTKFSGRIPTVQNLCKLGISAFGVFAPAWVCALSILLVMGSRPSAASFFFSTGDPDGKIATLSRPPSEGKIQTETADDFILANSIVINQATFTGLRTGAAGGPPG